MTKGLFPLLLAAGLAGCQGMTITPTPVDTRNDKEGHLPPGKGMFGDSFSAEWVRVKPGEQPPAKPAPAAAAAAPAAPAAAAASGSEAEEFKKWRESSGSKERQEFEEWRAWQEWKKKNPK